MPPDLNSLSPPNSSSSTPQHRSRPSVDTPPHSLPAMNPPDVSRRPSRGSPRTGRSSVSERRRSGLNLNLGDSSNEFPSERMGSLGGSPVIGTADPHHQRTPSLGELHQELEQEQEAQVNRLLQMIRSQQTQLQQLQQQQNQSQPQSSTSTAIVDDSTPSSEPSASFPPIPPLPAGNRASTQPSSSLPSRRASRPSSQTTSPSLRPHAPERGSEGLEWITGASESPVRRGSRDESSFYQAEASMLNRENQMLRQRIRDLERQVSELGASRSSIPIRQSQSGEDVDKS